MQGLMFYDYKLRQIHKGNPISHFHYVNYREKISGIEIFLEKYRCLCTKNRICKKSIYGVISISTIICVHSLGDLKFSGASEKRLWFLQSFSNCQRATKSRRANSFSNVLMSIYTLRVLIVSIATWFLTFSLLS